MNMATLQGPSVSQTDAPDGREARARERGRASRSIETQASTTPIGPGTFEGMLRDLDPGRPETAARERPERRAPKRDDESMAGALGIGAGGSSRDLPDNTKPPDSAEPSRLASARPSDKNRPAAPSGAEPKSKGDARAVARDEASPDGPQRVTSSRTTDPSVDIDEPGESGGKESDPGKPSPQKGSVSTALALLGGLSVSRSSRAGQGLDPLPGGTVGPAIPGTDAQAPPTAEAPGSTQIPGLARTGDAATDELDALLRPKGLAPSEALFRPAQRSGAEPGAHGDPTPAASAPGKSGPVDAAGATDLGGEALDLEAQGAGATKSASPQTPSGEMLPSAASKNETSASLSGLPTAGDARGSVDTAATPGGAGTVASAAPGVSGLGSLSSTQSGRAAASPAPSAPPSPSGAALEPRRVLRQVSDALRLDGDALRRSTEIALDPPELGRVRVRIEMEGAIVKVALFAEHGAVRDLVAANVDRLRQDLLAHGLQNAEIEVHQDAAGKQQQQAGRDPDAPAGEIDEPSSSAPADPSGRRPARSATLQGRVPMIDVTA